MQFQAHIPFVEHLGFELLRFEGGDAEIALTLRDELTNSWGVAHGGVTMTLLDVVMAHAARSPDTAGGEPKPGVVTVEMKTSFLKPGVGRLLASGQILQGSVFNEQDELIAHATGTFKYMKALPSGGRKIHKLNASD